MISGEWVQERRGAYDLAGAETNDNVGNGDIFGLAGSVRDHDAPSCAESVLGSLDSLGDGTDLVDLEEESVARLEFDGLLDEGGVGDGQIITEKYCKQRATCKKEIFLTRRSGSPRS
jgi:hypothetical protein